jgi:hypothetical protein
MKKLILLTALIVCVISSTQVYSQSANSKSSKKVLFNSGDDVYAYVSGTWVSQGSKYVSGGKKITFRGYNFTADDGSTGTYKITSWGNDKSLKQGNAKGVMYVQGTSVDFSLSGIGRMMFFDEIWIKQ